METTKLILNEYDRYYRVLSRHYTLPLFNTCEVYQTVVKKITKEKKIVTSNLVPSQGLRELERMTPLC
jgi:hypothetical protein